MKQKEFSNGAKLILRRYNKANRLTKQRALRKYADELRESEKIDECFFTMSEKQDKVTMKISDFHHTFSVTLPI